MLLLIICSFTFEMNLNCIGGDTKLSKLLLFVLIALQNLLSLVVQLDTKEVYKKLALTQPPILLTSISRVKELNFSYIEGVHCSGPENLRKVAWNYWI